VDRDVPADRDDDDVAMKGDAHTGSDRFSGWASGVLSASRRTRTVSSPPLAITGLPSRSTPTAIALATPVTEFQRQHRRNVETGCHGGTEGGEVTAEECCIAPALRLSSPT
jgi:hypothetical protein